MATPQPTLLTVGHSNHDVPTFLSLLDRHGVNLIADVRSQPYSRIQNQFNRETLTAALKQADVTYAFFGDELGARRAEPQAYQDGVARYDLIRNLSAFRAGFDRLRGAIADQHVCLLCAEHDPIACHRTILICRELCDDPIDIRHILKDGSLETTDQVETRLLDLVGLPQEDLFNNREQLIEQAYELQAERIAYRWQPE